MSKKLFIVESSSQGDVIIGIPRDARDDFEELLRLGEEHDQPLACQLLDDLLAQKQIMQQNEIHFSDYGLWYPRGPIDRYLNSKSRMENKIGPENRQIKYFMRRKWNDLNSFESPARYYGVRFTGETDAAGMNIYSISNDVIDMLRR